MIYRFIYNIVIVNNRNTNNNISLVVIIVFISCSAFLFYLSDRTISSTVEYFSACLLCTPLINPFLLKKKMRMIIRNRKWLCVKTKMCIDFRLIIDITTGYWLIWNFIAFMLPVRLPYLTCFQILLSITLCAWSNVAERIFFHWPFGPLININI